MTTLRNEIKKTAKETGYTELEIITAMQGVLAAKGDEENLSVLIRLKREYINL